MIPRFAVVGRSNKGKSSIVATLAESESVAIAATPRTTRTTQSFSLKVDGEELFTVFDTPGFEDAPAILEWLKAKPIRADQRQARIEEFYRTFHDSDQFRFECELLRPILEGASILYVADASHPFRANFEAEFEILQWTGRAAMALLNQIGPSDYAAEWQRALAQYFRTVKPFNAHSAWINDRIQLIEELAVLNPEQAPALNKAAAVMRRQLQHRLRDSAYLIADLIRDSVSFELKVKASDKTTPSDLAREFYAALRNLELRTRERLARVFGFTHLEVETGDLLPDAYEHDLFSRETSELFGLTRKELLAVGTASGAIAGGTIDAMVGGASLAVGTGIGGLVGSLSSAYLAFSEPKIGGLSLHKKSRRIGPYKNPNFPWILLDRQLAFVQVLLHRTHAQREAVKPQEEKQKLGFTSTLPARTKSKLAFLFQGLRWKLPLTKGTEDLANMIAGILSQLP